MEKKITKKEMFAMIKEVEGVRSNAEMVAFIDHEIELLEKKSSKLRQTKTQKENEIIIEQVFESLIFVGRPVTISELRSEVDTMSVFSPQKLSALLKKLVDCDRVIKNIDKKKSYFSVASEEVGE